jgi:hypothetical protein
MTDSAREALTVLFTERIPSTATPTLVHGCTVATGTPRAWVEADGQVWASKGPSRQGMVSMPIRAYYALTDVQPDRCTRYTPREALEQVLAHGTAGPWPAPPTNP